MKSFVFCIFAFLALMAMPLFGAEAAGEIVQLPDVVAGNSTLAIVLTILSNPAIVALIAGLVVQLIKYLHDVKHLDTDRWVGLCFHLYEAAESSGVANNWSGNQKLTAAMEQFDQHFYATFGHHPSEQDRVDFKNDVARIAHADVSSSTAVTSVRLPALPVL